MNAKESMGDRLAAENGLGSEARKEIRRGEVHGAIERERFHARWLGRAAIVAWALTLLFIPASAILGSIVQFRIVSGEVGDNGFALMIPAVLMGMVGGLSLIVAIVTSVGWMYRSRTASLTAIETRLDELEEELRRR